MSTNSRRLHDHPSQVVRVGRREGPHEAPHERLATRFAADKGGSAVARVCGTETSRFLLGREERVDDVPGVARLIESCRARATSRRESSRVAPTRIGAGERRGSRSPPRAAWRRVGVAHSGKVRDGRRPSGAGRRKVEHGSVTSVVGPARPPLRPARRHGAEVGVGGDERAGLRRDRAGERRQPARGDRRAGRRREVECRDARRRAPTAGMAVKSDAAVAVLSVRLFAASRARTAVRDGVAGRLERPLATSRRTARCASGGPRRPTAAA